MSNSLKYILSGFLALAGCAVIGNNYSNKPLTVPKTESQFAKTAVMITNDAGNSGGTGVILYSRAGQSYVLTNKHVCQLIQIGGKVVTDDGNSYPVENFRVYKKHDLCLIGVFKNLGVNVKVADKSPKIYSSSIVVGHPALLPTMITLGHFSQWRTIQLIIDMKECDGTETDEESLMCAFAGGKPVVKEFQAQATSSLIMPGSSGSAVFNDKGELSGLIFAGSQGLSYGFLVPWEYVHDFLTHLNHYPAEVPNAVQKPRNFFTSYFKLQKLCDNKVAYAAKTCSSVANLGVYNEQ
jgi:S1-C subfamily serine protease